MPSYLDNAASAICAAAGWRESEPDAQGRYHFSLRGGLGLTMLSPDGKTIVLRAEVQRLPDEETPREDMLRTQARLAVLALKDRPSTLALEGDALILHQVVYAKDTPLAKMPAVAEAFLNDLDWWKAQSAVHLA